MLLPEGAVSRVVARSGEEPPGTRGYAWHAAPDGGVVFPAPSEDPQGGWVYVSNSEVPDGRGGAGALRFDGKGNPIAAYSILQGTSRNCAGGPTPWATWLSCEEVLRGQVWECDPFGKLPAVARPALGRFVHEAAAVDPATGSIYLTEDLGDGLFYRYTPGRKTPADPHGLSSGTLEAARVLPAGKGEQREGWAVDWLTVPDPLARQTPTRQQVSEATRFNRGEGIWHHRGEVYFATTGDERIWRYHPASESLRVYYDAPRDTPRRLFRPDNLTMTRDGTVLVGEDHRTMRIVAIPPTGSPYTLVQLPSHTLSEMTGPALDPSGTRLYFTSQRGETGRPEDGITYEVSGLRWN